MPAAHDRDRLDRFLHALLPELSRARISTLIDEGLVTVAGARRKPAARVRTGEAVEVRIPAPRPAGVEAEPIPLRVVYEDADLLVVDKPAGMTVHPAPGSERGTLVGALLARTRDLSGIGGVIRPGIVHRLDRDTSGLLVVAKHDAAHAALAAQIAARTAARRYLALVRGDLAHDAGAIDLPIGRHPVHRKKMAVVASGRPAVTRYRVLERFGSHTLVEASLETGRTHQIRVHFAREGHPVAGDPVYGGRGDLGLRRQALHAYRLAFTHPRTGERLSFESQPPEDFAEALERLRHEAGDQRPGTRKG